MCTVRKLEKKFHCITTE